jgi:hypothetical protein
MRPPVAAPIVSAKRTWHASMTNTTNGVAPRVRGRNLGLERLKSSRFKSVLTPGGLN